MKVLVTAEAFGYGPIVTAVNVLKSLLAKCNVDLIFMGSGVALEQAIKSNLFKQYIEADTFDRKQLEIHKNFFLASDIIISFENIEGAVYGVDLGKDVFYLDNLFWMWDSIPEQLKDTKCYFIVDAFDINTNLKRIGTDIKNKCIVGPLRDFKMIQNESVEDRIVVNFGGGESFLIDSQIVIEYYKNLLELLDICIDEIGKKEVIVCGGNKMMEALKTSITTNNTFDFKSFAHDEYINIMKQSKYLVLSPGMGNMYETLALDQEVFFVPPINYSQFWQLENYRNTRIISGGLNWGDFGWDANISQYIEESIGVDQVMNNLKRFIKDPHAKEIMKDRFTLYLKGEENNENKKKEYFDSMRKDGVDVTVDEIIRRGKLIEGNSR